MWPGSRAGGRAHGGARWQPQEKPRGVMQGFFPHSQGTQPQPCWSPPSRESPQGRARGSTSPGAPLPAPLGDAAPGTAGGRGVRRGPGPAGPGNAKLGFTPWTPLS